MLGKLLKHETIAVGRLMLLPLGALVLLAGMANLSYEGLGATDSQFIEITLDFVIALFFLGLFAALVMAVVLMVQRFYKNLLGSEGYLMFTLPVSVHGLVWSKLLVACLFLALSFLVCAALFALTLFHLADLGPASIRIGLAKLLDFFDWIIRDLGAGPLDRALYLVELLLGALLGLMNVCLLFYAAMAIGQCFARNKLLLSVLAYLGLRFIFQLVCIFSADLAGGLLSGPFLNIMRGGPARLHFVLLTAIAAALVKGAVLYLLTVLPLQKKLNLE